MKIFDKSLLFFQILGLFLILDVFSQYYILTFEIPAVKCHHGVEVNWSRYQDTGVTDPALVKIVPVQQKFCSEYTVQTVHWDSIE